MARLSPRNLLLLSSYVGTLICLFLSPILLRSTYLITWRYHEILYEKFLFYSCPISVYGIQEVGMLCAQKTMHT